MKINCIFDESNNRIMKIRIEIETMKEFIWNLKCLHNAWKYRKEHEAMENQYQWYRYSVICDMKSFLRRFKFWKSKNQDLPF